MHVSSTLHLVGWEPHLMDTASHMQGGFSPTVHAIVSGNTPPTSVCMLITFLIVVTTHLTRSAFKEEQLVLTGSLSGYSLLLQRSQGFHSMKQ